MAEYTLPPKPEWLLAAEREGAALQNRKARLFALRDEGKITEEAFGRRYATLLRRLAVNEIVLKAMHIHWETFTPDGEDPPGTC